MKLKEVRIQGFGKLVDFNIDFNENINIVFGRNESGKSTLLAFIRAMLYGLSPRNQESDRKRYRPWKSDKFGGEMVFYHKDVKYRAVSSFGQSRKEDDIRLYNDETGAGIPIPVGSSVGEFCLEMTPDMFDRSTFASQLASQPEFHDGNFDFLLTKLSSDDVDKKQSYEAAAGMRLKRAMERLNAPETGVLNRLNEEKLELEGKMKGIRQLEGEVEVLQDKFAKINTEVSKAQTLYEDLKNKTAAAKALRVLAGRDALIDAQSKRDEAEAEKAAYMAKKTSLVITIVSLAVTALFFLLSGVLLLIQMDVLKLSAFVSASAAENFFAEYGNIFTIASFAVFGAGLVTLCLSRFSRKAKLQIFDARLSSGTELVESLLQGREISDLEQDWREAEQILAKVKVGDQAQDEEAQEALLKEQTVKLATLTEHQRQITAQYENALIRRGEEEPYDDLLKYYVEIEKKVEYYKEKYNALVLASRVLSGAFANWQASVAPRFQKEAGDFLAKLTEGKYDDLRIAKDFRVALRGDDGIIRDSFVFSGATMDQSYLAVRLALCKLLDSDLLVLDDPFVQYDKERQESSIKLLEKFTEETDCQIIITTCHRDLNDRYHVIEI